MLETLIPAYGRDYRSKAEVLAALRAGKDFERASAGLFGSDGGRYANVESFAARPDSEQVNVRYDRLRKVAVFRWRDLRQKQA